MIGFHVWDLLILVFFLFIIALIVGLILWAIRRPKTIIIVQPPYQGPGQPGAQPPYGGPYQEPDQYPGQPPGQYPPQ